MLSPRVNSLAEDDVALQVLLEPASDRAVVSVDVVRLVPIRIVPTDQLLCTWV